MIKEHADVGQALRWQGATQHILAKGCSHFVSYKSLCFSKIVIRLRPCINSYINLSNNYI